MTTHSVTALPGTYGLAITLAVFLCVLSPTVHAAAGRAVSDGDALLTNVDRLGPAEMNRPMRHQDLRRTFATLNLDRLIDDREQGIEEVVLSLFQDVMVTARKHQFDLRTRDNFTWFGKTGGEGGDDVVLTVVDGRLAGTVSYNNSLYRIRGTGSDVYEISEIDPQVFAPEHSSGWLDDLDVTIPTGNKIVINPKAFTRPVEVTVGVVYTWKAKAVEPDIQAEIQHAVDQTNQAFINSRIYIRLRLAATGVVDYQSISGGGDLNPDLKRFKGKTDGYLDFMHAQRDSWAWQADIMSLIVDNKDDGYCGVAYPIDNASASDAADWAFNVVNVHCMTSNVSFAHEVGHNLGARHDWTIDQTDSSNKGFVLSTKKKRTIMAYPDFCDQEGYSCPKIMHFSNPDVTYNGAPTGAPDSAFLPANNRRAINLNRFQVANFR